LSKNSKPETLEMVENTAELYAGELACMAMPAVVICGL
jgi:hypothetical protein